MKIGENLHRIGRVKKGAAIVRNQHRFTENTVFTGFGRASAVAAGIHTYPHFNRTTLPKAFLSLKTLFLQALNSQHKHHP
jgi:hypothetical protein